LIENGNNDNIFFSLAFLLEIKMRLFWNDIKDIIQEKNIIFLRAPVGRNKLNNLMKLMAKEVELPDLETKRIRNTSVCKHLSKTVR
jgi:hypothetical protein